MKEIPLQGGAVNAHQTFSAQLCENYIDFILNYLSTGQWSLDLYEDGTPLALGLMLEPNANLLEHFNLDIGALYFVGNETTLDNLGSSNNLVWVEDE